MDVDKLSRNLDCSGGLRGKILNSKEKLQFQRVFFEIFGLLKPEVLWKCPFFFAVIEQMDIRCTFINIASCDEQQLYRLV